MMKSPFLLSTHYVENHKVDFLPVSCARCNIRFYSQTHVMAHTCPPELLEQVRAKQQAPSLVTSSYSELSVDAQSSVTSDQFCIKEEPLDDWAVESSSAATDSSTHISLPTIKIEPNDGDYTPVFNPVNEASYLCLHCKQFFETPQVLNEHYCKVQFCKFCEKKFKKKLAFEVHMMTHHKMKNVCQFCDRKFKKGIFQHLKTHTNIQVSKKPAEAEKSVPANIPQPLHPCKICKRNLNSEQLWEAHMMDNHSSENECQFCGKTFQRNALLIRHLKSHTVLPYTYQVKDPSTVTVANDLESTAKKFCQICNKKFVVKIGFDRHMISQHKSSSTCQFCGSVFHNLRVLLKHVKTHTSIEPKFECEKCKEVLNVNQFGAHKCKPAEPAPLRKPVASVQSRKRSLSISETESLIEPPKVMKEGPRFPTKVHQDSFNLSQLKADAPPHAAAAAAAPKHPLACLHCDMSFANHSELRHHAKEAQVYCDFCRCTLPSSMEYESHMLEMHSMGRTCQFCGAQFGNKAALSLHLRRHTSLKPIFFKCFHCGEKFHTELEKQNHPCKAWTCEVCDVRFPNEEALENHSCDEEQLLSDSECENCQSKFSSGQLLLQHMQVSKRKQDLKDKEVAKHQKLLDDSTTLPDSTPPQPTKKGRPLKSAHKKAMAPEVVECKYCKKLFLTTEQYIAHCQEKHWYKCGVCGKKFEKEDDMEQHLIWHRVNAIAQQYNPVNPQPTASKTVVIRPIASSIVASPKGRPVASSIVASPKGRPVASSIVASPKGRPVASSTVVVPSGPRVVKESLTSAQTSHQPALATPTRTTQQGHITAFLCNTCGIYLSSSQALAQHKRSHMVFQCTQCSRVLSTARELAEHTQTHAVV
ncbi:hypothetical protein B566_EDAN015158 [Ephemera danica]|nr:hypothetical protein B566_EDAN015158 [Ephemera danica]